MSIAFRGSERGLAISRISSTMFEHPVNTVVERDAGEYLMKGAATTPQPKASCWQLKDQNTINTLP